jgi:exodeoxyribonuclease VII small subunit
VTTAVPDDIARMNFEDALAELDKIVRTLESGSVKLDESIAAYERGAQLRKHCETKLKEAQTRVDKIVLGSDGSAKLESLGSPEGSGLQ